MSSHRREASLLQEDAVGPPKQHAVKGQTVSSTSTAAAQIIHTSLPEQRMLRHVPTRVWAPRRTCYH